MMHFWIAGMCFGMASGMAVGQSFPIRALSAPVWAVSDADPLSHAWEFGLGTMERVGDVNGDGVDDLVVLIAGTGPENDDRLMWLYLGERGEAGSVSFGDAERVTGLDSGGYDITNFELFDHNGDGLDDLLLVPERLNSIEIGLSTGDGFSFGSDLSGRVDARMTAQQMLIEDIDGDGDQDYVISNTLGYPVGVWRNQGQGVAWVLEEVDFTTSIQSMEVGLSDFDGDGDMDLLGLNSSDDRLFVLEYTALGWAEQGEWLEIFRTRNFDYDGYSCFADVNGDGLMDVVAKGDADLDDDSDWAFGFFLAPFVIDELQIVPVVGVPRFNNDYSDQFRRPDPSLDPVLRSAGDLDGDGTDDLLMYPFEWKISGWRIMDPMNLNGRFSVSNELSVHGEGSIEMVWEPDPDGFVYRDVFIDVNGDGVKDKMVATFAQRSGVLEAESFDQAPGLMVWGVLGNPFDPRVVFDEQDAITIRSDPNHVLAVDLDGDEDPEILYTSNSYIKAVDRDLDGLYKENRGIDFRGTPAGFRSVVASMDGDPNPDVLSLALARGAQAPSIFLNPMASSFGETILNDAVSFDPDLYQLLKTLGVQFDCFDNSFSVGDVDGDGINDIVLRGDAIVYTTDKNQNEIYSGEAVLSWIGDGAGGLSYGAVSPIRDLNSVRTFNMELIDFNRDGLMDVVAVGNEDIQEGYVLQVLLNGGGGSFELVQEVAIDETPYEMRPYWIVIEDLDGDGYQDVLVLLKDNDDLHEVAILYGTETGLSTQAEYVYGGNAAELVAVDLDGNGLRDLLTCSYESDNGGTLNNSISIMYQNEARDFGPIVSINDVGIASVNVADLNRDGGIDLIAGAIPFAGQTNVGTLIRVFYSVPAACRADLNFDRQLDFFDISLFIRMYVAQRPLVDFNTDEAWDFFDLSAFLELYAQGCE